MLFASHRHAWSFKKHLILFFTNAFPQQLKEVGWQIVGEWAGG